MYNQGAMWLPAWLEVMFFLPLSAVQRGFLGWLRESGKDAVVTVTQLEILQVKKAEEEAITNLETQVCQSNNGKSSRLNTLRE